MIFLKWVINNNVYSEEQLITNKKKENKFGFRITEWLIAVFLSNYIIGKKYKFRDVPTLGKRKVEMK